MEINTDRLLLRSIRKDDASEIFKYRSDSETNKYQGWIPKTIQDTINFIYKVSPIIDVADTWYQMVIIEKSSNEIIGDVGIHFLDTANKQCEIGCTLNKEYQGNGYATEALKQTISYLFYNLNKHRVTASVDPGNIKSINMLERLKFRREAHFTESILVNGEWHDDVIYSILKKEWTNE